MANRSKKVVLSTRIAPHLKDGLELFARVKNMKIVEAIEELIDVALESYHIESPLRDLDGGKKKVPVSTLISWLWSEDPIIYKLRLAYLGHQYVDEETFIIAAEVMTPRFSGDFDLFEYTRKVASYCRPPEARGIDIVKVRSEWDSLVSYAKFVVSNKPLIVAYDDFITMLSKSKNSN
ncbi:hypothetical protein [Pseudomonas chlororaphis]|uniref:hypothetical protein n=1 Tax=Pseudomonas chlororaphis TaxID=587753 RepID=UPI0039E0168F